MPGFGDSKSSLTLVELFYTKWDNFTSYRSFSWTDKYNPNEAENRYVKRMIDKENLKERK